MLWSRPFGWPMTSNPPDDVLIVAFPVATTRERSTVTAPAALIESRPDVMVPSDKSPAESAKETAPAPLLAAKDVTLLFCVLRLMAEPLPLTVKAPAVTAPL